ncbi:MAG: site-specific DNA-methyltransferase [Cetobacterium sp.]
MEFENIKVIQGDCLNVMKTIEGCVVDCVMTSPPYNNSRNTKRLDTHEGRYDVHIDKMDNNTYIKWTLDIFNQFDRLLKKDGVVLYNINYGSENLDLLWLLMSDLILKSNFMIADVITWKKKTALPNNTSKNKLTRITEFVFVICRKSEVNSFNSNKRITKTREDNGQNYYENIYNFVEAKNNDGSNKLNKATYSTDFCKQILEKYISEGTVLDPFNGTGTTGLACCELGLNYIGIELSEAQCELSLQRIKEYKNK